MSQRFYRSPYSEPIGQCNAAHCSYPASWVDTVYDTIWCDFHATAECVAPARVRCAWCSQWCFAFSMQDGVCSECRTLRPVALVDGVAVDSKEVFDAILARVSPDAQKVILEWLVTGYDLREMLDVQFPLVADAVLTELATYDAVVWDDGLPEFDFGRVKL